MRQNCTKNVWSAPFLALPFIADLNYDMRGAGRLPFLLRYTGERKATLQLFINNHLSKLNYSVVTSSAYTFTLILLVIFAILFWFENRSQESIGR